MIVGPTAHVRVDQIDEAQIDTVVAAAVDAIEARLGAGEDRRAVIVDVVGALFAPFGRSPAERADLADRLLEHLADERRPAGDG